MNKPMRKLTLLPLAALLAALIASAPAARAQSASFIVSQHGKPVGTASFTFTATPHGYASTSLVSVKMQGLNYSLSKTERLSAANSLRHVQLSAIVNGSAVNVTADPGPKSEPPQTFLTISANGRVSTCPTSIPAPMKPFSPSASPATAATCGPSSPRRPALSPPSS
jgi:hypothetical protein